MNLSPRLTIDYRNESDFDEICNITQQSSNIIVDNPSEHYLILEKMELPTRRVAIDNDRRPYNIIVDVKDQSNIPSGMIKGFNLLTFYVEP